MEQPITISKEIASSFVRHDLIDKESGTEFGSALTRCTADLGPKILSYLTLQERASVRLVCKAASHDKVFKTPAKNHGMGLMQSISQGKGIHIPKCLGPLVASFLSFRQNVSNRRISKACATDSATSTSGKEIMVRARGLDRRIQAGAGAVAKGGSIALLFREAYLFQDAHAKYVTALCGAGAGREASALLRPKIYEVASRAITQAGGDGEGHGYRLSGAILGGLNSSHTISNFGR